MRKTTVILFFAMITAAASGCGSKDTANANQPANSAAPAAANSNVQAAETPLPVFPDAATAITEGDRLLDANKTVLAIDAYRQAVKMNPDYAEAYFKLGIALSLVEMEEKEAAKEDVEATPTPKGKVEKAVKTESQKAFESAVKAYKKIIDEDPKDHNAFYNLGRAYNKLDQDKEAEKALRQAVKLSPEENEYQTELGAILIKLAQYDEAVRVLKKALEQDPSNLEAEELLEKAEAGKKRIGFSATPKPQATKSPTESGDESGEEAPGAEEPKKSPTPKPTQKSDKKGNQ